VKKTFHQTPRFVDVDVDGAELDAAINRIEKEQHAKVTAMAQISTKPNRWRLSISRYSRSVARLGSVPIKGDNLRPLDQ
jgi:hypothetical protein